MSSQIKNKARVKSLGEVFTNPREVKAMCDLIPDWKINTVFLEPACGNGNFLVEILSRKLNMCNNEQEKLLALNTIFGIDIMQDNIEECKARLTTMMSSCNQDKVKEILDHNIVCGDFLTKKDKEGNLIWFLEE